MKLERLFEDYSETIKDPKERRKRYENGAERILEQVDKWGIPEEIILSAPHPEYFPLFGEQVSGSTCGCNAMKAMFMTVFGTPYSESRIWNKSSDPKRIKTAGIGPVEIARIIKTVVKRQFKKKLKVFATNQGDLRQVGYFLERNQFPIINRPWYGPERGNHYEFVFGLDENNVYMHNPAANCKDSGLHKMSRRYFLDWWALGEKKFRWYLVPVPVEDNLPKSFKGRFL